MSRISKPYTFVNNTQTADGTQVNANFDAIFNDYNGNVTSDNFAASGFSDSTKLAKEVVTQTKTQGVAYTQDLFQSAFVLSGGVATKDGTTANILDVTAIVAYTLQSDGSLRRISNAATTFTTNVVSTTYYLDLNPDGSWWWGTAHTSQQNYLSIAQVTTDSSGNISGVKDERTLNKYLIAGTVNPNLLFNPTGALGMAGWTVTGGSSWTNFFGTNGDGSFFWSPNVTTAGTWSTLVSSHIPSAANQTYHIHGQINTSTLTAGNAMIYVFAYDSSGTQLQSWNTTYIPAKGTMWQDVDVTITTPANTDHIVIELTTDNLATGYAAFRKIKAEQGSIATTFSDDNTLNTVQYGNGGPMAGALSGADTWHQPTLQNGWKNYGGTASAVAYRKTPDGLVVVKGFINQGTTTSGTLLFTFPSGYRPAENKMFTITSNAAPASVQLNESDGTLVINAGANSAWLSLDGLSFFAEQ